MASSTFGSRARRYSCCKQATTRSRSSRYQTNFAKDEFDLLRVWLPADIVCFSVPLYLRLPVRHVVSFVWTAYLSFSRGGH